MADRGTSAPPGNRHFLLGRLAEEVSRAARHQLPLALVMFHVDTPGVPERPVDEVARAAVLLTRGVVRHNDVVGPLGNGQFAVVANAPRAGANALAEAVARHLRAFEFTCEGRPVAVTLQYGLSCLGDSRTAQDLLDEACSALCA